jgi:hypothetical protein
MQIWRIMQDNRPTHHIKLETDSEEKNSKEN